MIEIEHELKNILFPVNHINTFTGWRVCCEPMTGDFEACHLDYGRVWGKYKDKVFASSLEAYEAFYRDVFIDLGKEVPPSVLGESLSAPISETNTEIIESNDTSKNTKRQFKQ